MSSFEINKIAGAILLVALTVVVIGMVRDALFSRGDHDGGPPKAVVTAQKAAKPAAKPEAELAPIAPLLAAASEEKGAKVFRKCASCHSSEKGAGDKIGPNLWNIVNAGQGERAGFKYSSAMAELTGKWTYENLNKFLAAPKKYLPGTRMGFAGVKKAEDRADLIRYLRSLSDSPAPLP